MQAHLRRPGRCVPLLSCPSANRPVTQACQEYLKQAAWCGYWRQTGIRIRYEDPKAVGADRVCDAVAVMHLYGVRLASLTLVQPPLSMP